MKYVMTVLGPVAPQALGFCQSHEHLCILDGQSARCNPALRIDDPRASRLELEDYRAAGGGAVVDAQRCGAGRVPPMTYEYYRLNKNGTVPKTAPHYIAPEQLEQAPAADKWVCSLCGYEYDGSQGPFEDLPGDWKCPLCGAPKSLFVKKQA